MSKPVSDVLKSANNTFSEKKTFRGYLIYTVVVIIGVLLLINAYFIYKNSEVIEFNKRLQEQAERIKVNTLDIIRNLHQSDMGLRGYYLLHTPEQRNATVESRQNIQRVFVDLETALSTQDFPIDHFYAMRDSINAYYELIDKMVIMVDEKNDAAFLKELRLNKGFFSWKSYMRFSKEVNQFEDRVAHAAKEEYEAALKNSYVLQIILFLVTVPALLYMAFYTVNTFSVSERLRLSEIEKGAILSDQKEHLERMVTVRTNEIRVQNEQITLHNEQLKMQRNEIEAQHRTLESQNQQLLQAQRTIEDQNGIISKKNDELIDEVERQTRDLKETNRELIEQNSRLEQFNYIISHNLRAPMARLVGLSTILDFVPTEKERANIIAMMIKSTSELDHVIRDLSQILAIQKLSMQVFTEIDLKASLLKSLSMLDKEMEDTSIVVCQDLLEPTIYSLPQYVESILYNLISNAIKYRDPERKAKIVVSSRSEGDKIVISVSDNGLGIDLTKHRSNLFNLYKRFHFHVEGKGLGLYLVRTQVEAIGGKIEIESKEREGTVFTMTF